MLEYAASGANQPFQSVLSGLGVGGEEPSRQGTPSAVLSLASARSLPQDRPSPRSLERTGRSAAPTCNAKGYSQSRPLKLGSG